MFEQVAAQKAAPCQSLWPRLPTLSVDDRWGSQANQALREEGRSAVSLQLWVCPSDPSRTVLKKRCHRIVESTEDFIPMIADVGEHVRGRHHQGCRAVQGTPERRVSPCLLRPAAEQAPVGGLQAIVPGGPCSGAG